MHFTPHTLFAIHRKTISPKFVKCKQNEGFRKLTISLGLLKAFRTNIDQFVSKPKKRTLKTKKRFDFTRARPYFNPVFNNWTRSSWSGRKAILLLTNGYWSCWGLFSSSRISGWRGVNSGFFRFWKWIIMHVLYMCVPITPKGKLFWMLLV